MSDVGFVIAGWGVVLGGLVIYAITLLRRVDRARRVSLSIRRDADKSPAPNDSGA